MNSHVNSTMPHGGHLYTTALLASLQKHSTYAITTLAFALLMGAMLFVPLAPITTLIPSFYTHAAAIGFGLLAATLLLRAHTWQPFYFPVVAFIPLGLVLLVAMQIALNLMSYWQQHVLVIAHLLWATLMVMLGAELRREFDLKKLVPVFAAAMLVFGLLSVLALWLMQMPPTLLGVGLALVSLAYLWVSKRIRHLGAAILSVLLISAAVYAHQASLSTLPTRLPLLLQHNGVLAKESWHIFLANPLLGAGWGQFAWQDLQLANVYPHPSGITKHPHNLPMQLLAETGIAGFAIVVLGLGFWLKRNVLSGMYSNALSSANLSANPDENLNKRWLYACLLLLGIVALFNNALQAAPVLGLGALMVGLLEERILKLHSNISAQFKDTALLGQLSVFVLFAIGAMTLITTNRQYTIIENWYQHTAQFTQFQEQQKHVMLNTLGAMRHQSLLTPYIDTGIVRVLPNRTELLQDKLAINTQLLQHSPQAAEAYNQAELLAMAGQAKLAKQQLKRAINRHPDYLYGFSMKLIKSQSQQTLPLLFLIVRHNKKEIAEEQAQAKTGKQPNAPTHNKNMQKTKASIKAAM